MTAAAVPVTVSLPAYHHTHELVSGAIALAGMCPTFVSMPTDAADIADLPLLDYLARRQSGDVTMTALPVFPARAFVHSWIHVPVAEGGAGSPPATSVETVPALTTQTATVYARGLLAELKREPDEIVVAAPASPAGVSGLLPLFEHPAEPEREEYARTGVYPILSVVAVRTALLERERWLASNVFRAFEVARRRYFARLQDIRGSRVPIPSVAGHLRYLRELFGPDLWPYGVEPNRATLEAFVRYAQEQGLIAQAPDDVADLFADIEPFVDYTDGH